MDWDKSFNIVERHGILQAVRQNLIWMEVRFDYQKGSRVFAVGAMKRNDECCIKSKQSGGTPESS